MSNVLVAVVGNTNRVETTGPLTTSRTAILPLNTASKANVVTSLGAVNETGSPVILTIEASYDGGATFKKLWRQAVAANTTDPLNGLTLPLPLSNNAALYATAASGSAITVSVGFVTQ